MLKPGTRFGPYEVVATIGRGGMGEVYRAKDNRLGREIAMKVLPEEFSRDPERLRKFEHEARATAALSHPNVVVVYDVGQHGGLSYVVMELLDGETLGTRLKRTPLLEDKAVEIAIQVASGLAATHAAGIVHRDLKPDNIFLTRDGRAKILDFGIAKIPLTTSSDQDANTLGTDTDVIMGTLGYMSPEQVRGIAADGRSDIFSLGAILYETLSGRRAFKGQSDADTLCAILEKDPPPLSSLGVSVAPALQRIIVRCLEKDPLSRFQSSADLKFALESAGTGEVATSPKTRGKSIAVLPLVNMGTSDQDYFSDGLAEELINALAQLSGLRVVSRSSSFRFRASDLDVRDVGRQLNVDTILEGSVRRAGNRLRVTVQLINVSDGYHIWSERYDREFGGHFCHPGRNHSVDRSET